MTIIIKTHNNLVQKNKYKIYQKVINFMMKKILITNTIPKNLNIK